MPDIHTPTFRVMTSHQLHQASAAEAPERGHPLGHFDTLRVRFVSMAITAAPGEGQGPIQDLHHDCLPDLSRRGVSHRIKGNTSGFRVQGWGKETEARRGNRQWFGCCDTYHTLSRNVFGFSVIFAKIQTQAGSRGALNAW